MVGPLMVMESTNLVTPSPIYKLERKGAMRGKAKVVRKRRLKGGCSVDGRTPRRLSPR